jgi:hypothetical protein
MDMRMEQDRRQSVYLESTIPSYLVGWTSKDPIVAGHQTATKKFWEQERQKYRLFISDYVLDEISLGDTNLANERLEKVKGITLLPKTEEIGRLAGIYKSLLGIPDRAATDCNHLAICVVRKLDFLLSWNCTHLGPVAQEKMQEYNSEHGLWVPVLVTPEALLPSISLEETDG